MHPVPTRTGELAVRDPKSIDVVTENDALRERGRERAPEKRRRPDRALVRSLETELEGHAATDQPQQHEQYREIQGGHQDRERARERRQQSRSPHDEPGFVAVPDRRHRSHHQGAVPLRGSQRIENAHAEIEAVEQDVHENRERHDRDPNRHQINGHDEPRFPRGWMMPTMAGWAARWRRVAVRRQDPAGSVAADSIQPPRTP